MIGVIFMFKNKGPLMFINTVNSEIDDTNDQKIFDSRNKNHIEVKPREEVKVPEEIIEYSSEDNFAQESISRPKYIEERKIKNIIEMYNRNRPVLCNVVVGKEEIVGIPYKLDEEYLYIKLSEDSFDQVKLEAITDVIIIRF
jgi:hypothetical protein